MSLVVTNRVTVDILAVVSVLPFSDRFGSVVVEHLRGNRVGEPLVKGWTNHDRRSFSYTIRIGSVEVTWCGATAFARTRQRRIHLAAKLRLERD